MSCALFASLALASGCSGTHEPATGQARSAASAQSREAGKRLRLAIDNRYRKLVDEKQLKPLGQGINSIADVLPEFIPVGTSFEQATAILESAGFVVGQRQRVATSSPEVVIAKIDPYSKTYSGLAGKTSIVVVLEPSDKADWKSVGHIEAEVLESFL